MNSGWEFTTLKVRSTDGWRTGDTAECVLCRVGSVHVIAGAPWGSVDGGAWLGRLQLLMGIFSGFLLPAVGLGWFVEYEEQFTSKDLFDYTM